ncbi:MAG: MarR family transcriptional regulator, partial [Candidatus Riflebacteria bacterium]|nr:MarR family transcriptional regulator [Candidatus Riflebacteria bacterium]
MEQKFMGRWVALTYRATHAYMAERLQKLGLGYGQFPFLCYLNRCGVSSQEEISRALVFDKATTARALKKL